MFVRYSVHLSRPCEECLHELLMDDGAWFPRLNHRTGDRDGERFAAVGFKAAGIPLRKRVAVQLGKPRRLGSGAEVELAWRPTSSGGLLPDFDGKVQLDPVGPGVSRVTVSGIYKPPLGELGSQLDQAILNRVAEATARELAEQVARELDGLIESRRPSMSASD
jgi:hypothetical protein